MRTIQPLSPPVLSAIRATLPDVAERTIVAVKTEVPEYRDLPEAEGTSLASAVQLALEGFLAMAVSPTDSDPAAALGPTIEGAYELGRAEAGAGRTMDSLLSAYRVGARVAWQGIAGAAAQAGMPAGQIVAYAAELFAYIDRLSASSVSGHADELAVEGRVQERLRERLAVALLEGKPEETVDAAAHRAGWLPPPRLMALVLPAERADRLYARLRGRALHPSGDVAGLPPDAAVLLLPVDRPGLLDLMAEAAGAAVLGPQRPWREVAASYRRAVRAWVFLTASGAAPDGVVQADDLLPQLVATADPEALADLRQRALAPLADLPAQTQERLVETLRAWLLLRGRREAVATALFVHPQTVRYRMGQLRERYGDRLDDPRSVLELVVALAV